MNEENKVVDAETCCADNDDNQETLGKLKRQEQNWKLMTILQIPWHHAERITEEEDRAFLLNKAKEVETFLQTQQMNPQMNPQMQQGGEPHPSPIIAPN